MGKIDHSSFAWKVTKNRMVLSDPTKAYAKASAEQNEAGKSRRKLEDMQDDKAQKKRVSEVWDEH